MAGVLAALERAQACGAVLCHFPELAVTGFHRQIAALARPELVAPQVRTLQRACARLGIAAAVGAPTFGDDFEHSGCIHNSHLLIDAAGRVRAQVHKAGLTAPEATFFAAGAQRPVVTLAGQRCTAVICREIEDFDALTAQLAPGSIDVVLWPGQMRPDPDKPLSDPPAHVAAAQRLARALGCFVVQANWPNAINRPEESAHMGRSAVLGRDGTLLLRLPESSAGLGVFTLGQTQFDWIPEPDLAPVAVA